MKLELKEYDDDASFYYLTIENRENDKHTSPCRAYRKTFAEFYGNYINEVVVPIKKEDLPDNPDGYKIFDKTIEPRINQKTVRNKINFITFFSEKTIELPELLSFEDVNLLADFQQRYNDHFVTMPFTLKFRDPTTPTADILEAIKKSYTDFKSTIQTSNLLGYVPAYASFRDLENFIKLYTDNKSSIKSHIGTLNFVPLMVDLKNTSPDNFMRSLSKLYSLKKQYLNEGYYLFYYGFSPRSPSVSQKRNETLAKEFLLAYLGFDVIGASFAMINKGGGNSQTATAPNFEATDFKYHLKFVKNKKERDIAKPNNYTKQTKYLREVSEKLLTDSSVAINELKKRKEAYDYVESYKT